MNSASRRLSKIFGEAITLLSPRRHGAIERQLFQRLVNQDAKQAVIESKMKGELYFRFTAELRKTSNYQGNRADVAARRFIFR